MSDSWSSHTTHLAARELLYMCRHTLTCVLIRYTRVLILLYSCPHTAQLAARDALASALKLLEAFEQKLSEAVAGDEEEDASLSFLSQELSHEISLTVDLYDSLCEMIHSSKSEESG